MILLRGMGVFFKHNLGIRVGIIYNILIFIIKLDGPLSWLLIELQNWKIRILLRILQELL